MTVSRRRCVAVNPAALSACVCVACVRMAMRMARTVWYTRAMDAHFPCMPIVAHFPCVHAGSGVPPRVVGGWHGRTTLKPLLPLERQESAWTSRLHLTPLPENVRGGLAAQLFQERDGRLWGCDFDGDWQSGSDWAAATCARKKNPCL